jgi:transposase
MSTATVIATEPSYFVGIDWATRRHEVCVLKGTGAVLGKRSVPNTAAGLDDLVQWLLRLAGGDATTLAVAIERPDGPVVETLLDREIAVYCLNPKQLDRFRDRHCVAGAKDDRRDALVLADALRTDRPHFHRVAPLEANLVALRGLARSDDALRIAENRLSNQFQEHLRRYFPQLLDLAADRPDPFLWDLWNAAPTPEQAQALSPRTVAAHLRRHHLRRFTTAAVLETLGAPAVHVSPATVSAAVAAITLLLPQLRLVHAQRVECGHRIDDLLKELSRPPAGAHPEHSDAAILRSLPGVGRIVLARVLTDAAEAIRHRDLNRLRALGGSAPVTKRSGQSHHVLMRRACNARLRFAYYHWARTAVQRDPRSRAHYQALRQRGRRHGRALRGVVDRLLAVAVAMLRAGTLYDPALRRVDHAGRNRPVGNAAPTNTRA